MRLSAVVAGGLLAASLAAMPPADAANKPDAIVEATKTIPRIEFLVARGGPNACGPGCDSWIAAEGLIDDGAPARLRRVLDKLGDRKLPVFFYSPGGDTAESLAIGRLLRRRGLAAGVAVTVPVDCVPAHEVEACSKLMRQPQPPEAALLVDGAACNSACAYAILGAVRREIAPTAQLGVHSGHSYLSFADPEVTQRARTQTIERGQRRIARDVQRYLADMGIDQGLFKIASETKFESMHVLTRAELFDLGIDRREVADSGWHFSDLPGSSLGSSVLTTLVEKEKGEAAAFRQMALAISCGDPGSGTYKVSTIALLPGPSPRASTSDIRIGNGAGEIWLLTDSAIARTTNGRVYEVRKTRAPRSLVEQLLLAAPTISFVDKQLRVEAGAMSGQSSVALTLHPLSSLAAATSLKALAGRCEQGN
jgi:hypothetical protein